MQKVKRYRNFFFSEVLKHKMSSQNFFDASCGVRQMCEGPQQTREGKYGRRICAVRGYLDVV